MSENITDKLAVMLLTVTLDLEAEIRARYDGSLGYPSERKRFDRDMHTVYAALGLLEIYRSTKKDQ